MLAISPLLLAALLLGAATACGGGEEVLVFAASSLTDVMERLGDEFEEEAGVKVSFNFGASGSLAQQIVRGAPADVFIAAGNQPMSVLEEKGDVFPGTRVSLLTNTMVVVTSADGGPEIASVNDLLEGDYRIAIADPDLAPAGQYARQSLTNLGLWTHLEPRLVYGHSVRTTLGYVESRNVGAALVYGTDAAISDGVRIAATVPESSHPPITYPGAVVRRSENQAARRFLDFLTGERATAVFQQFGFVPVAAQ